MPFIICEDHEQEDNMKERGRGLAQVQSNVMSIIKGKTQLHCKLLFKITLVFSVMHLEAYIRAMLKTLGVEVLVYYR